MGASRGKQEELTNLGLRLGLFGYPEVIIANDETMKKTALQYIENHDHSRFVCNFGTISRDNELLGEGARDQWFKVQPYLIAMFMAKGVPMLWQGQEFGENYYVPEQGWGRVLMFRPVRWDYFYDPVGKAVITLVRKLIKLRGQQPQFRYGEHFFYNHYENYQSKQVLLFHRKYSLHLSLVALNFSDFTQWVPFTFPIGGEFKESLHGQDDPVLNIGAIAEGETRWLEVPSNYGRIWTLETV